MALSYHPKQVGEVMVMGKSTDTKPPSPGSEWTFIESDTGKHFYVVGGVWTEALNDSYGTQSALGIKAPLDSPTFTGTVTIPTPFTLGAVSVTPTGTELNFVDGVTSGIQDQLDTKATTSTLTGSYSTTSTITGTYATSSILLGQYQTPSTISGTYITTSTVGATYSTSSTLLASYQTTSTISGTYVRTSVLVGTYATTSVLLGQYQTPSTITGTFAPTSVLIATYAPTSMLLGQYQTPSTISGTYPTTSTLTASYPTTSTVSGTYATTATVVLKAPIASPTFTGLVTTPAIKITTGAGTAKVLTSDLDGDATWEDPTGGGAWGAITGTLADQTDLQTALDAKQATLVSATNIKTVNSNSLLGAGDVVISGDVAITETEVDFGETPVTEKTFTITEAGVSAASKIIVTESGNVATGRVAGDSLWDSIVYSAIGAAGTFTLYARASGAVVGKRKLFYTFA